MLGRGVLSDITRKIPVPRIRNINDVSGLYPLQQSLVIGSHVAKMLVRRVQSDKYKTTQEQFEYQGVEICMAFRTPLSGNAMQCTAMHGHIDIKIKHIVIS